MVHSKTAYIIAEAGVNHNGSLDMALQLIDVAADAGADAVKFQTFKADRIISKGAPKAQYQEQTTQATETQYEMVKRLELDESAHRMLIEHCKKRHIEFLSTPFDLDSLDMLVNGFRLPIIKLPSGEVTNGPLLLQAARYGTNIILSTGMCNLGEIETALGILAFGYLGLKERPSLSLFEQAYNSIEGRSLLKQNVTLLHCTTEYPAPLEDVNLRVIDTLKASFDLPVGYSDHTMGVTIPVAAVARGACMIEKHFTLDRQLPGPDHKASLEPAELVQMVRAIRDVEKALGSTIKSVTPSEIPNRKIARKSIVASKPIYKGEVFTEHNLGMKRPGNGLSPLQYWDLLGGVAERDYAEDEEIGL